MARIATGTSVEDSSGGETLPDAEDAMPGEDAAIATPGTVAKLGDWSIPRPEGVE